MSKFIIQGGAKLSGKVKISGAKNSALKLLAASIMAESPSTIHNVPRIKDIEKIESLIEKTGAKVTIEGNSVTIDPTTINSQSLDKDLSEKIRASVVLAGPMLSKYGTISFYQPGGCLIGARKIDDHLDVLGQFDIDIKTEGDKFILSGKPKAEEIVLPNMSVTATENAIMASVLSKGKTTIRVAAAEPEIQDLTNYLNSMGAKINNMGHTVTIEGVDKLNGTEYTTMPDRIEAATYLMMAVATNSEIEIDGVQPEHLSLVLKILKKTGAKFDIVDDKLITNKRESLKSIDINTRTYPGFPTDLQSVYTVYSTQTEGSTRVFETIFESRFGYIEELQKMNANINVEGPHIVNISGPDKLTGTSISSTDIRGGAALILAALLAEGTTTIDNIEQIERGYENIDQKLRKLGVSIEKDI